MLPPTPALAPPHGIHSVCIVCPSRRAACVLPPGGNSCSNWCHYLGWSGGGISCSRARHRSRGRDWGYFPFRTRPRRWGCTKAAALVLPLRFMFLDHSQAAAPKCESRFLEVLLLPNQANSMMWDLLLRRPCFCCFFVQRGPTCSHHQGGTVGMMPVWTAI